MFGPHSQPQFFYPCKTLDQVLAIYGLSSNAMQRNTWIYYYRQISIKIWVDSELDWKFFLEDAHAWHPIVQCFDLCIDLLTKRTWDKGKSSPRQDTWPAGQMQHAPSFDFQDRISVRQVRRKGAAARRACAPRSPRTTDVRSCFDWWRRRPAALRPSCDSTIAW